MGDGSAAFRPVASPRADNRCTGFRCHDERPFAAPRACGLKDRAKDPAVGGQETLRLDEDKAQGGEGGAMSDVNGGPGWWIASDGKWYRPGQRPNYLPPPPLPTQEEPLFVAVPMSSGAASPTPPSVNTPTPSSTDETQKRRAAEPSSHPLATFPMEHYMGGFSVHRRPESSGRLILTSEARWELHFAMPGSPGTSEAIGGPLSRYPLELEATSPNSCHVTIRDLQNPTDHARLRLPHTSINEVRRFLGDGERPFAIGELANYNGGLPTHPKPESSGFLSMKTDGHWKLSFPGGRHVHGPIQRYRLDATNTDSASCHVTIRDARDPSLNASFDLPDTSIDEFTEKISRCLPPTRSTPVPQRVPAPQPPRSQRMAA